MESFYTSVKIVILAQVSVVPLNTCQNLGHNVTVFSSTDLALLKTN